MTGRTVILSSAASGVGSAVIEAAELSLSRYRIIGINSKPALLSDGRAALLCPPTREKEAFLARVTALLDDTGGGLVVPGRDEDATVFGEAEASIAAHGGQLISGPGWTVASAFDKAATSAVLGSRGLSMAMTAHNVPGGLRIGDARGWPLLVKPRFGNASRRIRIAEDAVALGEIFNRGTDVIQELLVPCPGDLRPWDRSLPGGLPGEYSLQMLFDRTGQVVGRFGSRNVLVDGVPRLVETVSDAQIGDLVEMATAALGALPVWGAWNFQGMLCPGNEMKIFEINARFTGITGLRARLGFNELDILYDTLVRGEPPARFSSVRAGILLDTVSEEAQG